MNQTLTDLAEPDFWWVLAAALAVLLPLRRVPHRRWAWAAVNAAFLGVVLHAGAAAVIGGAGLAYLALRAVASPRWGRVFLAVAAPAALALFLLHKLPDLAARAGAAGLNPLLAGVGFSYVALRLVEVTRAVYERRRDAPDFPSVINYLLPFHMLPAGPIQSYDEFVDQPAEPPPLSAAGALSAAERIAWGLSKKFILAFVIDDLFLTGFRARGPYFVFEALIYFLWLFLDFSAYSDIAVGVGRLLGVATPENFNRPYLARNMIDFWERWHMSLSLFIRRNLFIPLQLGLARRSDGRRPLAAASFAFTVSFVLCGAWHGVSPRFLAWGAMHASGLVVCNLYRHFLVRRLGRGGVAAYLADVRVRALMTALTYAFVALSLVIVGYPWEEIGR